MKPDAGAFIHTVITAGIGVWLYSLGILNVLPLLSFFWLLRELYQHKSMRTFEPFTRSWWDWVMPVTFAFGATLLVKLI